MSEIMDDARANMALSCLRLHEDPGIVARMHAADTIDAQAAEIERLRGERLEALNCNAAQAQMIVLRDSEIKRLREALGECVQWMDFREKMIPGLERICDRARAALAAPSIARPPSNCRVCGRIVDTRERSEGGDPYGAQQDDGGWCCSEACYQTHMGGTDE